MLTKRGSNAARSRAGALGAHILQAGSSRGFDRRSFLKASGLGGVVALTSLGSVKPSRAAGTSVTDPNVVIRKNICTHCSVGCSVNAEVVNGVWLGQEPEWRSPHQSRHALRQGRLDPRTRQRRAPSQVSVEARRRPVEANQLGSGV